MVQCRAKQMPTATQTNRRNSTSNCRQKATPAQHRHPVERRYSCRKCRCAAVVQRVVPWRAARHAPCPRQRAVRPNHRVHVRPAVSRCRRCQRAALRLPRLFSLRFRWPAASWTTSNCCRSAILNRLLKRFLQFSLGILWFPLSPSFAFCKIKTFKKIFQKKKI